VDNINTKEKFLNKIINYKSNKHKIYENTWKCFFIEIYGKNGFAKVSKNLARYRYILFGPLKQLCKMFKLVARIEPFCSIVNA